MTFAVMTIFLVRHLDVRAAKLLELILAGIFTPARGVAIIVLVYIFLGGPDVGDLQRGAPVLPDRLGSCRSCCWRLKDVAAGRASPRSSRPSRRGRLPGGRLVQLVAAPGSASQNPMGVEWFGWRWDWLVLSFGYWCTDFLVVQRADGGEVDGRGTPQRRSSRRSQDALSVPGDRAGHDRHRAPGQPRRLLPVGADGVPNYNLAIPVLLAHYLPSGLLASG